MKRGVRIFRVTAQNKKPKLVVAKAAAETCGPARGVRLFQSVLLTALKEMFSAIRQRSKRRLVASLPYAGPVLTIE